MENEREIRIDILIKQEDDHVSAHCLQFDLVATADTFQEVQKEIIDLCVSHIQYSYKFDNMDYLFSPAPQESWAEYYAALKNPACTSELVKLNIGLTEKTAEQLIPAFMAQELLCNVKPSCHT